MAGCTMTKLVKPPEIFLVIKQHSKSLFLQKKRTCTYVAHKFYLAVPLPFVFYKIKIGCLRRKSERGKAE